MPENILERLKAECSFSEVFQDTEKADGSFLDIPRRKIGHIRADYNGCRWWNTVWHCHQELATQEIAAEIDQVYNTLTASDGLADFDTLIRFCQSHPEACADQNFHQEYNFYLEGKLCNFWIRLITRAKDYNLYLNAFTKDR